MNIDGNILIMIPVGELEILKQRMERVLFELEELKKMASPPRKEPAEYMTAMEFMNAVRIRRWTFDRLIAENKIRTIKKKRKIYVPISEVERYFNDPTVL